MWTYRIKRIFDFCASLLAIIVLSPLLGGISLAILLDDGKPVLFRQQRVGKDNQLFEVWKFRTMRADAPNMAKNTFRQANQYITRSGRWLRRTGFFDELPQLFNILRGEMSIVGPRPLIPQEEEIRALREEYHVYDVLPGITGLAQVRGRDKLTDEQKAQYDKEYVEKFSIRQDIRILFQTVKVVLRRENLKDGDSQEN